MVVKNVDRNSYEKEVIKSGHPALLCFVKNTAVNNETIISIEELSQQFGLIQFCLAQEEDHEFFFEKFHFLGTPIFIFLVNGTERERLIGSASVERLISFINRNIRAI